MHKINNLLMSSQPIPTFIVCQYIIIDIHLLHIHENSGKCAAASNWVFEWLRRGLLQQTLHRTHQILRGQLGLHKVPARAQIHDAFRVLFLRLVGERDHE